MRYQDLFKAVVDADQIDEQEKEVLYSYICAIIMHKNVVDPSGSCNASQYIALNSHFIPVLSKCMPIHIAQLYRLDSMIKHLIEHDNKTEAVESECDVVSVSEVLRDTIIHQVSTSLKMIDMDGKRFLLNMEIGNKRVHLQVDTITDE